MYKYWRLTAREYKYRGLYQKKLNPSPAEDSELELFKHSNFISFQDSQYPMKFGNEKRLGDGYGWPLECTGKL